MLLPHRTAWTTQVEFQAVYADLFESEGDAERQRVGLSRIAVWQSRNQCPSAVETTANLLRLILRDAASSVPDAHELRLSYSMAIIRFVNSLVDPLQTAYFARSISSLAAQLGLPLWFVELRHQATHEDLPALPVLREGARQALDWLFVHYWQPTMSTSPLASTSADASSASTLPPLPLEPFLAALESYKSLAKALQKDASQAGRVKNELGRVWRDLERWAVENGASVGPLAGAGGKKPRKSVNPNGAARVTAMRTRERAMETVARVLVDEPGWLVPLAKKKRPSTRSPALPQPLVELYTPLLEFLDESLFALASSDDEEDADSDSFLDTLVARIVDLLCAPDDRGDKADPTVHMTLRAWLLHLVPVPTVSSDGENGGQLDADTVETTEGIVKTCLVAGTPSAITVVEALVGRTQETLPELAAKVEPLLRILRTNNQYAASSFGQGVVDAEEAQRVIERIVERSSDIERKLTLSSSATGDQASLAASPSAPFATAGDSSEPGPPPAGRWAFVSNFKPSPIGALPLAGGGFEGLDLVSAP
ncbi:hypothetical protein JCM11491_005692 [Sporobolomyces phaffii]